MCRGSIMVSSSTQNRTAWPGNVFLPNAYPARVLVNTAPRQMDPATTTLFSNQRSAGLLSNRLT